MENANVITVQPIQTQDAKDAQESAVVLYDRSTVLVIQNQADYEGAASCLQAIKSKARAIDEKRKEITKPLDAAKKAVMDLFRKPLELLSQAEGNVKNILRTYDQEQEKIRQEQEAKLRRQAEAEEARKKKALEERAKKAEEKGNIEKAEALREQKEEVLVEAPVLAPRTETPKGISYKDKWVAIVTDFAKLPNEYKLPNMPMLHKMAQATKGKVLIPGVEFKVEKIVAGRI